MAEKIRIETWVTPEQKASFDRARGLVSMAAWLRDAADKSAEQAAKTKGGKHGTNR